MKNYNLNIIQEDCRIREALQRLNELSDNFPDLPLTLLITNRRKQLVGTLTDGDIRRTLVAGSILGDRISTCMNKNFVSLKQNGLEYCCLSEFREKGVKLLPIQNDDKEIVKVYNLLEIKSILPLETIIMAGGMGTRLQPMTLKTPKPLLNVGDKPIIQHNVNRLRRYGIENITFTIRYLGDQIVSYFSNGNGEGLNVRFIHEEDEPLGTAGGLSLIDTFKSETILLTNSDVLTTLNYEEFYVDFIERGADISVVTIPYSVKVPYGVFDMQNNCVSSLKEKPEYTYFANAGIYLIKKELIDQIPKNKYLDITDFIEDQIARGRNIVSFPFWGYWLDIGKPEDFENAQKAIQILDSY